ncbi:MAG: hypothetical protein ACOCYB_09655 [Alkalispirochaeta sp.]
MVRAVACILLVMAAIGSVGAEVSSEVSIDIYNSLILGAADLTGEDGAPGEDVAAGATATAQLDLRNAGSRDVRSWFQLRSTLARNADGTAATIVDVPRAEVRWRMSAGEDYTMRYTAGRTRLTWGEGVLYNAGDVLNGAGPGQVDLTADTLRDETLWVLAGYFPVGRFSFVEPVILVPMSVLSGHQVSDDANTPGAAPPALTAASPRPASEIGAGGRMQGQVAGVKSEIGYLYHGTTEEHRPYVALQGNLFLDWYGSASWSSESQDGVVSGGVLYNGVSNRLGSWSARTEALWDTADTAVEFFPEITWSPSRLFSLFLRGLTSTDAKTYTAAAGVSWTPATGLTLSLYGVTDTAQELGVLTAGVSHVF